ncbi:hypothetical protein LZ31DRAFT_190595 [Colletotrichum somersetense]|nr:hypothetical protein LZ31DRAFT_190595 [Colletotrichum somersetense]
MRNRTVRACECTESIGRRRHWAVTRSCIGTVERLLLRIGSSRSQQRDGIAASRQRDRERERERERGAMVSLSVGPWQTCLLGGQTRWGIPCKEGIARHLLSGMRRCIRPI